jgi:hypothetical protein
MPLSQQLTAYLFIYLIFGIQSVAQVIPPDRLTDWTNPGSTSAFTATQSVNLISFGADTTGVLPVDAVLQQAIIALNGPGEIFFPKGLYLFNQSIILPDSIILLGETDTVTKKPLAKLSLAPGNTHGIIISGSELNSGVIINYPLYQGEQKIYIDSAGAFTAGDFIKLKAIDDSLLVNNSWAYHSTGQIFEITSIDGDTLYLNKPLRRSYTDYFPQIVKVNPSRQVHIKCLIIERIDVTADQTSNIFINKAVDCSVYGIESYFCNYAHIDIFSSTRVTVGNSFFKDGHSYGSGGKAYGVMLEFSSGDCYIFQNNFEHLRHSIIFQAGANGNVVAYNYSKDPYWTGTLLPANSAGDLVFHGNYPYMNLLEGNVVQNIVIDNSHGINGPNNLFFRNRAELYGIFMNTSPASDKQTFIGNQVINASSPLYGQYALQGSNHFEYGNMIKGNVVPAGTSEPVDTTLFNYDFNTFYQTISSVPPIRNNNWLTTTPLIAAQYQSQNLGITAACMEIIFTGTNVNSLNNFANNIIIFPNPFTDFITIRNNSTDKDLNIILYNTKGLIVKKELLNYPDNFLDFKELLPGMYLLKINGQTYRIVKL